MNKAFNEEKVWQHKIEFVSLTIQKMIHDIHFLLCSRASLQVFIVLKHNKLAYQKNKPDLKKQKGKSNTDKFGSFV